MKNQITLPNQGKISSGSSRTSQQGNRSNCHQKNSLSLLSVISRGVSFKYTTPLPKTVPENHKHKKFVNSAQSSICAFFHLNRSGSREANSRSAVFE